MKTFPWVLMALRALLIIMFLATVLGQVVSWPGEISSWTREGSPFEALRWPLIIAAVLVLLCVQVVIVATWKLLTMVKADRIFSSSAFSWVDVIVYALGAAWGLFAASTTAIVAVLYFTPALRDPGTPIMLGGMVLTGGVVFLLMLVLRALLRQAAGLRSDMDEVI